MATLPQMQAAVGYLATKGYRITSQSDTQVQLLKPKQRSCLLLAVLLLLGVIPGLVYLAFSTDKSILLTDTGLGIQSNTGKGKAKFASYYDLNNGQYSKLFRQGLSPVLLVILTLLFILGLITSLTSKPSGTENPESNDPVAQTVAAMNTTASPSSTPSMPQYTVTQSTNFYENADIDSATLYAFEEGYILKTANGEKSPECKTLTESDITLTVCKFRDPETGTIGWVLEKWVKYKPQ
jgi:hypothetical protein